MNDRNRRHLLAGYELALAALVVVLAIRGALTRGPATLAGVGCAVLIALTFPWRGARQRLP